ncbi:MAG TPA: hypothetical protein VMU39_10995 [Solirubrobacteraceae bacterium]|nr:hypothetical protein [Solirubrobacteraceae bacterium]
MSPYRVINRRNQLLELHVADQVVLVEPLGTADLPETQELPPDVLELERRLLIDIETPDEVEQQPEQQPRKPRRRATTTQKRAPRRSSASRTSRGD